ncbi:hypothetical protein HK405_011713 [Cladochytrium tenue]|nr:hypothetical protein HK405_011713 [Cladochytrium tenue]
MRRTFFFKFGHLDYDILPAHGLLGCGLLFQFDGTGGDKFVDDVDLRFICGRYFANNVVGFREQLDFDCFHNDNLTSSGLIGYWPNWAPYSRGQNNIDKLDLTGVSIINYAFLKVDATGELSSTDSTNDAIYIPVLNGAVRDKYPNLLTVVSIGGWSRSDTFSTIASSSSATAAFVKNIHDYLDTNGFDGVDIDWEYPNGGDSHNAVSKNDAKNFATLLAALRAELGADRLISIAVVGTTGQYTSGGVNYIAKYAESVSFFNIMAYDMYSNDSPYTDFNSPLDVPTVETSDVLRPAANLQGFSIKSILAAWKAVGVSDNAQLVLGVGFYGHSWTPAAQGLLNGAFQLCEGAVLSASGQPAACKAPVGDYLDAAEASCTNAADPSSCSYTGVWSYLSLRNGTGHQPRAPLADGPTTASNGFTRAIIGFAESATLYSDTYVPATADGSLNAAILAEGGVRAFISYDDVDSLTAKAQWAKSEELGGVMVWELSMDYQAELLGALRVGWGA